jgi:Ca2+-binding EF-hand superfamily protein
VKQPFMSAVLAVVLAAGLAHAQTPDPQPNAFLLGRLQGGATLERYLKTLQPELLRLDADANGKLDSTDLESHNSMTQAMFRSSSAGQIMNADLDGDGAVTAPEMRRKLQYDRRNLAQNRSAQSIEQEIETQVEKWLQADTNKDGKVSWQEAIEAAKQQPDHARAAEYAFGPLFKQLQELTPQGQSGVTLADLETAATALFRRVDTDNNGTISIDEIEVARRALHRAAAETMRRQAVEPARPNCEVPKASEAAKVVLLGAYETESLSTVALGSQDEVTGVGNVTVEPGNEPLYVVITTYQPTIWRFYGSTNRIERVVVVSQRELAPKDASTRTQLAGVVGVPADKISFPKQACVGYFHVAPSTASAQAAGTVKAATGKSPDVITGKYELGTFNVPSGKIEAIQGDRPKMLVIEKSGGTLTVEGDAKNIRVVTPSSDLQRELLRFNPGGVVTIDATKVVASTRAEPYQVLPQQAGLIQLVQSGALTQNEAGEFLINRKIRFPAGLAGAHSVKFLLRRGVPEPDGDPGHSDVIAEETGAPLRRP